MTDGTLILGANLVGRALTTRACMDAIARTLRAHDAGRNRGPVSAGLTLPEGSVHAKLAAIEEDGRLFVVVKANVNLPGNPGRNGRPTIQGAVVLLDGQDGRPLAVMDSIVLTSIRTAAVAALAAEHLAVQEARAITIVGCGEQGEAQLRAMAVVRNLRIAFAVDSDASRAMAFAERMASELGIRVGASTNLRAAVGKSDICVTCTPSHVPLIFPADLHPGLFIAAVGADNPAKQEIDAAAMARSSVVVDSLAACAAGGDLHHAIKAGAMTEDAVRGELSAIVAGRLPGRTSADDVFVFDSTGTAIQDAAAALLVYRRAAAEGGGLTVRFDDRPASRAPVEAP